VRTTIIGAGLGGLTLAHGLRREGIDVTVFERGTSAGAQPASYGIHLDTNGLRALHACLPAENWRRLDAIAGSARDFVRFHDQHLRTLAVLDRENPTIAADPITRRRGIRRDDLRNALLHGLEERPRSDASTWPQEKNIVRWDKRFERYEHLPDGQVRAWFTDATHTDADLLVGADGSNSRVRHQRLPDLQRLDLGIINIAGSTPLTPELNRFLPEAITDGSVNNVIPTSPGWMFLATWLAPANTSLTETQPGTDHSSANPNPARADQIVWAWVGTRTSYPPGVEEFGGDRLQQLIGKHITNWAPALRKLVADTDPATIAPVTLRTMPTLPPWPSTAVTLLGDAIHNMTPMGGVGANTALRDADRLRHALTAHLAGHRTLHEAVADYEHHMRDYANKALAMSTRNARNAATEARIPRLAFRTILRLAETLPPIKRAMFTGAS
jgi:2-polyprenyl-6-methoxyphenol hydroxylase-like FAD-dependent oxidoreductase